VNPNIAARLAERAAQVPGRDAIVQVRGRRTDRVGFGELAERVARTAAGLREMGIGPDRRVLLFVPMSIDLYVAMLATLHAGATAVFVDAWADRRRLDAAVAAARPDLFLGRPRAHLLRLLGRAVRGIPKHRVVGSRWFALGRLERDAVAPAVAVPGSRPALITFTTGTTGKPKAAARSHDFLWAQHLALAEHLRLRDTDVDMPTLPVFVLNNLALGVTSVIPDFDPARPASIDPARILKQAVENGVTTTSGSPAFYDRLLGFVEPSGGRLPFRDLWTGGAPVYPPLARRLAASVPGGAHVVYGSTEAEPIAGITAGELVERTGSAAALDGLCAGIPVPGIRLKVIRPHEGAVVLGESGWGEWEVPWGEAGEIVVAGDHVLGEYLDSPEETRLNKIRDGETAWHRTGDGGRLDADGRLWLLGRIGSRVRRGDTVWWSTPAELRASSLAPVRHAAYLGAPDRELGERAVLCVESGEARSSLEPALRSALGPIPVDEVRVLDRIPRDPRHASRTDTAALRRILGLAGP
jgi:olefin beta-lactone synthetase